MNRICYDRFFITLGAAGCGNGRYVEFSSSGRGIALNRAVSISNAGEAMEIIGRTPMKILLFTNKILRSLNCLPKGFVLFGMAGVKASGDRGKALNAADFFKKERLGDADIYAVAQAAAELSGVIEKCPLIENIYLEQEHEVQNMLDQWAHPSLAFSREKTAVAIAEITRLQNTVIQNYKDITGKESLRPDKPQLGQIQSVLEKQGYNDLTYDNWNYNNLAGNDRCTLAQYIIDVLEDRERAGGICRDLHWFYTDRREYIRWINKIRSAGYALSSAMCLNFHASTGRIFTLNEYLQGLPKTLRHLIAVPDGMCLVSIDYSTHEPGIYASLGRGKLWNGIQDPSIDIYTVIGNATASLTGAAPSEARNTGKLIMNSFVNGITWRGVDRSFRIGREKAEAVIVAIHDMFGDTIRKVREIKEQWYDGVKLEYGLNGLRYCRYFGKLPDPDNSFLSGQRDRHVMSGIVQGISALVLKAVLLRLPPLLQQYNIRLIYPVHDSLLLLIPIQCMEEAAAAVRTLMDETLFEFIGNRCERMRAKIENNWMEKRPWS